MSGVRQSTPHRGIPRVSYCAVSRRQGGAEVRLGSLYLKQKTALALPYLLLHLVRSLPSRSPLGASHLLFPDCKRYAGQNHPTRTESHVPATTAWSRAMPRLILGREESFGKHTFLSDSPDGGKISSSSWTSVQVASSSVRDRRTACVPDSEP